jgi:hypothetical protein
MRISTEGKFGLWLGVIGLAGAGALVVAPAPIIAITGWALIGIAALGAIGLVYHHLCERIGLTWKPGHRLKMTALAGMIISGCCLVGFSLIYFGLSRIIASADPRASVDSLDRTIALSCNDSARPTRYRDDRLLYVTEIVDPPTDGLPAIYSIHSTAFPQGNREINWEKEPTPTQFFKCTVLNYGTTNVFRASFEFTVSWLSLVKTSTGIRNGHEINTTVVTSPSFDLGAMNRSEDYFYICNRSQYFAKISIPEVITLYTAESEVPRTVKAILSGSSYSVMILSPLTINSNPPAASPLAPAPPDMPKEK